MLITFCVLGNLFDRPINVKPVIFFLYAGVLSKLSNPLKISFLGVPIYYPFRASALSTFNISIYIVNPNYPGALKKGPNLLSFPS